MRVQPASAAEINAGDFATLGVAFMLMTPLAPRDWAALVDIGSLAVTVLRDREERMRLNQFPKWESSKINPEKVACFSSPKTDRQLPSFHQQSTATSPPKNHV
jgi:hypothetical protein